MTDMITDEQTNLGNRQTGDDFDPTKPVRFREPTTAERIRFDLTDAPRNETDEEAKVKADELGKVYFDLLKRANEPVDPKMDDDAARAEAVYFTRSMTGMDDVPGKLWRKGGFATGKEYLSYMRDFFKRSPQENKTQELRDFEAMDEAGQTAAALEAQKTMDFIKHLGGSAATAVANLFVRRGDESPLTDEEREGADASTLAANDLLVANERYLKQQRDALVDAELGWKPEWGVAPDAEKIAAASKEIAAFRDRRYLSGVRAAYHAKLLADNAWIELSGILPRLSEDGRACTKALMDSPDNKLPTEYYAKFNNLPDDEKQMLIRARTVLAPKVEGGFWNTIGDMGVGLANITASLAAAPYRFGNKIAAKFIPGVDEVFDLNEISRRRQYLWQATGDFAAGGGDGFLPQLQFEQICEDHGFVAEALIGAVTTLPYMAAASVRIAGVAEVALEAMSEMDDHVAMNGGDITDTDYMVSSAVLGAMYAYAERLQVEGLLGSVSDLKIREAMLKGVWAGIKDGRPLRSLAVGTFSESLQEGVQNGIASVNEALALDGDAVRAFGEGFTEDFIGSLGTMFVIEGTGLVGGHVKRSGYRWGQEGRENRSTDLEKEYMKFRCQDRMVDYEGQSAGLRAAMQSVLQDRLYNAWKDGGKDALLKAGVDQVQAEEWDYYFKSERKGLEQEEETGEAVPMDKRSVDAQKSLDAYLASEAKKIFDNGRNTDADLAAFDLAMENLDWVRQAWAQGHGVMRQDGDKTIDPGAKALEKLGFTPDVAARLSRQFAYERAAAYSPAALAGIRQRYEQRTKGQVSVAAATVAQFGGSIIRIGGADHIQFKAKDGTISLVRIDDTSYQGVDFEKYEEGVAVDVERATRGKVTKKDWEGMTPDERREVFYRYGLTDEGYFSGREPIRLWLPADPSASVTSSQAANLIGRIVLNPNTDVRSIENPFMLSDTSAGFHEVFHAFSYFAQASGLWTKEDIAYLEKTFGKAKHSRETFDEEQAAEAFRSFLARRAAGAMTVEDEKSPFARIYAAAAGLDRAAAEKKAYEQVATRNEKAFFEQLIAEANKPKPTPPAPKPQLPKSAAPQKAIQKPTGETSDKMSDLEARVAALEKGITAPAPEPKNNPTAAKVTVAVIPTQWEANVPNTAINVRGRYVPMLMSELVNSDDDEYAANAELQKRYRKDNKISEQKLQKTQDNFFAKYYLHDAADTSTGAPLVAMLPDKNGKMRPFVLSGNGRISILRKMKDEHFFDKYRNYTKTFADQLGIELPSAPEGDEIVIVRVIEDLGGSTLEEIATFSNTENTTARSETEQAKVDAETIRNLNLAPKYVANADGKPNMRPGVNDDFFRLISQHAPDGARIYDESNEITEDGTNRCLRALLFIAIAQGERGPDTFKKVLKKTNDLGLGRARSAMECCAAAVAALESNTVYAIGPDVSRAMADYMDYLELKGAGTVGTFKEYEAQGDLFDPRSYIANEIVKLLLSDKSAPAIAAYINKYVDVAGKSDVTGALVNGSARTRDQVWDEAAKFTSDDLQKNGGAPTVVVQPASVRPAPVVQPTATNTPVPKPVVKTGLKPGSISVSGPAPAPAPRTATDTYTITTAKGETIEARLPPGGHTGLRGPYDAYGDVPESPNPIRSIFSGKVTIQKDPQGRYWGDKMPQFMGHKTEMFDRTVQTLREKMSPQELANFDTVVDYFGGGGCWGMSLALATMPNVKRIIINEFDPARASKIELLQTLGEKIADEAEKMLMKDGILKEVFAKMKTKGDDGGESGSGATLANLLLREYKPRFAGDKRKLGLLYAITDCASRQIEGSRDVRQPDGTTTRVKITIAERWQKVKEQLANDGKNASEMRKEIEKRGGTVEYVNGNSTLDDFGTGFKTPHGGNVMAVCDPPYYRTEGYSDDGSSWKVGLEKTSGGYAYADTGELMKRLVDKGDGIVYTDEAWWLKPEYLTTHNVTTDGFLDDAAIIATQREYRREHGILKEIRNTLDHFDVAGRVAGRYETLGVHHGNDNKTAVLAGIDNADGTEPGSKPDGSGSADNGRHSVRRLAGGAEGEDRAVLRDGREGGQRSEDVVRAVNDAIIDGLPDGTYGFPGQLATLERIIRHSVRNIREDKQTAYAKTVAKNAKAYLKRAAADLDKRMKQAGYTDKVWHGTGSGQFQVFRLATREAGIHSVGGFADDGIKMAFFSYQERTAENYAALSAFDIDTDYEELYPGAKPDVREYYISPGKCLDLDEKKFPQSYKEWTKTLHKAWKDGYDSIRVKGALDDQLFRLNKDYSGIRIENRENLTPEEEHDVDAEGAIRTDILVVFDHGEKNPGANRIKAADPITFWDEEHGELPIPPEMRANKDFPDLRFSIQAMGKNAVVDPAAKAYMDAVKRPDANERTTRLAPNGKRSNLTNALYHLVRTKRFKDWFGDWEVANLFNLATKAWNDKSYIGKFVFVPSQKLGDKLKDLLGHEINEVVITADSVRHMKKHHGDAAYEATRGQIAMTPEDMAVLPYVLNNFDDAVREPTYDLRDGNKAVTIYKRINGVSIATTISKGNDKQFVVSGWKLVSTGSMPQNTTPNLNALSDVDVDIVQKEIAEVKRAAKDCSKVVDENGEPKLVYHYSQPGITAFDIDRARKSMDVQGFYFYDDKYAGEEYGEERYETFLNIRNPKIVNTYDDQVALGLDLSENESGVKARANLLAQGFDGIISTSEYLGVGANEITAFNPEQIKSAGPVTYDDEGNVIPLSQRFNADNSDIRHSIRSAWAPDFPKAVAQTTRANIMAKYSDLFSRAKAGDVEAAEELIEKVVKVDKVRQLGKDHPNARIVAPVVALEASGHNMIPRRYAEYIASILDIEVDDGIVQTVRANHTGSDAQHRLFTQPEFDGPVEPGAEYIIVDDHITQGGTINALRDHIESNGGKVVAVSALTLSQNSSILSPRKETLDELKAKWPDIDNLLRDAGVADSAGALTENQARYILKFSPDTFRNRAIAQGVARGGPSLAGAMGASASVEVGPADERRLSPENEKLRHSIIAGAMKSKARKDPDRAVRLYDALNMYDAAVGYDDKTREEIYIQTGWWRGVDGKWRVEIPSVKPKQKFGKTMKYPGSMGGGYTMINGLYKLIWKDGEERMYAPLKDMAIAPMMFDAYPQLKDIDVVLLDPDSDEMEGLDGFYDGRSIGISWDCVQWKDDEPSNVLNEQGVSTLTHEIQHIVQAIEGFAYGGNPKDYGSRNYQRLAGEVEARNASRRNTNFKMYGGFARLASTSADPDLREWAVRNGNAPWQTEDVPQAKQIITYGDGKMTDINGKPVMRHSVRRAMQDLADGKEKAVIHNETYGDISYPLGSFGKLTEQGNIRHGLGLLHIVFARMVKEGATLEEAIDTAIAVADAAEIGTPSRDDKNRLWLDKDGTRAVVAKNADGKKIITGYEIYADEPKVTNRASSGSDVHPTPRLEDVISALKSKLAARPESTKGSIAYSAANVNGVEQDARRAITAAAQDGGNKAAQDALENYVAYFKLAHGPLPRPRTLARIGLSLGMNVVDPKRIIKNADKLAERMRGTTIESAAKAGNIGTAMALLKQEKDLDKRMENLLAEGVKLGGQLTHKGVGQVNTLLQKRVERMMGDFTAATLADMEGDTGINLAAEILENNPDAFETEYRKAKKLTEAEAAETADQQQSGSAPDASASGIADESEMSDRDRYKRQILMREQAERVARFIEEAKARAAENNAQAADRREKARQRIIETGDAAAGGEGSASDTAVTNDSRFNPKPSEVKAGFKTPEEFAAFLRVWAADRFAKQHGNLTIAQAQQDRLFAEFYRICARQELQDLADKLLAPKMLNAAGELVTNARVAKLGNGARAYVNRRLQEMEKGVRPDTIERMSADVFAFINKAAVRVSRIDLITNFKKDLKERFLHDPDFDEFKEDTERKVTGWVEEATRYICRVCDLSRISVNGDPSQLEQEYRKLHEIIDRRAQVYDESGREVAAAAQEDAETIKAQWKLALLDKYGAMRSMMPGEILDLQNAAFKYLEEEAAKLEEAWRETREQQDQIRRDFCGAIVGPNGQKYQEKGIFNGRLFDALNGLLRLRLQHLTRFASDEQKAKAKDAINSVMVMLGDGETQYAKALQADREAFFAGLGQIFRKPSGNPDNAAIKKYLERLDSPIPRELAEKVSNQGYADSMTYGQLLQLLVSLEQRSFADAIKANGREGQAELIRSFRYRREDGTVDNVITSKDSQFIEMLRAFYAAKRDQLSEVTMRMVGHKVDSPDPLYCPVRRWIDDKARSLHTDPTQRWDPISKIFSRRVESDRDFDESRTIIGLFFENSKESAKLIAWAERGSFIRNVVTSVGFQTAVKRAFGNGELGKILKQLEATFNGGEQRSQTPGEVAAADKAVNFVTYAYLGFNPLSALKQTTSVWVWANVLDGGFADVWRHMTHFDPKVLKHLMESDEYKVRYGNEVGSGMDYATKGLNMNPSQNAAMRAITGAGMWLLKRGDFVPGGWIAQGVYKDLLDKHTREGMDFAAADKLAITETFNLLEETQQSGRTYNTNMLQIEHGRIGRLLTQFATSPLQQLQYETQAWREWRDMVRYQMGEERIAEARQRFWRAVVINHVLMPTAMNLVIAMYKAAMGEEPPWEKDGYHWSLLIDVLMGQFSRVFFLGAFAQTTLNALLKRESPRVGQLLPIEGALGMASSGAFLVHDLATMNYDKVQKDLERAIKSSAPTRIPYNVYRRVTGDSDQDRKAKKKTR